MNEVIEIVNAVLYLKPLGISSYSFSQLMCFASAFSEGITESQDNQR